MLTFEYKSELCCSDTGLKNDYSLYRKATVAQQRCGISICWCDQ